MPATIPSIEHATSTARRPDSIHNLLRMYGYFPIAYHTLQPDLRLFHLPDIGYLAYACRGNTNYVVGDPIGDPNRIDLLLDAYMKHHPRSVFIQVSSSTALRLKNRDLRLSRFGIETTLPLPYELAGGQRADVRHLCNRAVAANMTVRELDLKERQSPDVQALLLGPAGVRRRFAQPFRFLARAGLPIDDTDVRLFGGYIGSRLVGLSVFDPMWWHGRVTGYAEVIPRRTADAPKGTRSFILCKAMERFSHEGIADVNLGLSPMAAEYDQTDSMVNDRSAEMMMRGVFNHGSWIFNFRGLAFHKSRFRGHVRSVYLATPRPFPALDLWRIYRMITGRWLPPPPDRLR